MTENRTWWGCAVGGIVGPVAFVGAWVHAGITTPGYSPVTQAISELAAVGAPTRLSMTAGFVVFGVAVPVYAQALRRWLDGPAWIAATVCGIATLAVAAIPLGWFSDGLHGVAAGTGYVALALTPLLAAPVLRRGRVPATGTLSYLAGTVCALGLAATVLTTNHGFFQRAGLLVGDIWILVNAIVIIVERPRGPHAEHLGSEHPGKD